MIEAHGQHDHAKVLFGQLALLVYIVQVKILGLLVLVHRRDDAAPVGDAGRVHHVVHVSLKALAKGTDVHGEHGDLQVGLNLFGHCDLLGGVHAAGRGAEIVTQHLIAASDTMDEGDLCRGLSVGRALEPRLGAAGQAGHPLELDAGQHIGVVAPSELSLAPGVKGLKAGGEHHRADGYLGVGGLHVQVNGLLRAGFHALATAGAGVHVNDIGLRHGSHRRAIDCLPWRDVALVIVRAELRADLGAQATVVALVHVHVARLVEHLCGERAGLSRQRFHLGVGHDVDVGVDL